MSLFDGLNTGMNSIGTLWILVLMVVINGDIFGRWLFNSPITGVKEVVEFSIVGIVYLQLGHALKAGRMTQSDALFSRLLNRHPKLGNVFGIVIHLMGATLMTFIWSASIPRMIEAYERGFFMGPQGQFTIPMWPLEGIVMLGCMVVTIQFLIMAWHHGKELSGRDKRRKPIE